MSSGAMDFVAGAPYIRADGEAADFPTQHTPSADKDEAKCWAAVASVRQPMFALNPDGRLGCLLPPGCEALLRAPASPRSRRGPRDDGRAAMLELAELLRCHQSGFLICLLFQLALELALAATYLRHAEPAVQRVAAGYPHVPVPTLWRLFWGMVLCDTAYLAAYYGLGISLFIHSSEAKYQLFSHVALLGVIVQVLIVYMSRLNLIAFFCRLVCYAYSGILQKLKMSLDLGLAGLPAPPRTSELFAV